MALTQVNAGLIDSTSQPNSFKNRIINGDMMIDQRNAGASVAIANTYALDRWITSIAGGSGTVQRVASTQSGFAYDANFVIGSGVTLVTHKQRIEANNCTDLASGSVTVSGYIYIDSVGSTTAMVYLATPTSGSPDNWSGGTTYLTGQSIALASGQYTYFSKTFALPANATNGVLAEFQFASPASKTIKVTGVQLEKGSTATSFDYRPYGTEYQLCQRYYNKITGSPRMVGRPGVVGGAAVANRVGLEFPVVMRAAPTLSLSSGVRIWDGSATPVIGSASTTYNADEKGYDQDYTGGSLSGLTAGRVAIYYFIDTSQYIAVSAEL